MQARHKAWLALVCGILTALTLLVGAYGWRNESAAVLALVATPMFAVLALTFGVAARHRLDKHH